MFRLCSSGIQGDTVFLTEKIPNTILSKIHKPVAQNYHGVFLQTYAVNLNYKINYSPICLFCLSVEQQKPNNGHKGAVTVSQILEIE